MPKSNEENLPAVLDFSSDANKGFDSVEPSDFGVPIVKLLQKMSPAVDDPLVREAKTVGMTKVLENGDELKETVNWYLTIINDLDNPIRVLFPMMSTQLRISRKFISLSSGIKMKNAEGDLYTPPMFSHVYKIVSQQESNNKGTWYSMNLSVAGPVQDSGIYETSKEFYSIAKNLGGSNLLSSPQE